MLDQAGTGGQDPGVLQGPALGGLGALRCGPGCPVPAPRGRQGALTVKLGVSLVVGLNSLLRLQMAQKPYIGWASKNRTLVPQKTCDSGYWSP